jgi:hypothetical protein
VLAEMSGGLEDERELHRRFAEYRLSGEWFQPNDKLLGEIASINTPRSYPSLKDVWLFCTLSWADNRDRYVRMRAHLKTILGGRSHPNEIGFGWTLTERIELAMEREPDRLVIMSDRMPSDPYIVMRFLENCPVWVDTLFFGDENNLSAKNFFERVSRSTC